MQHLNGGLVFNLYQHYNDLFINFFLTPCKTLTSLKRIVYSFFNLYTNSAACFHLYDLFLQWFCNWTEILTMQSLNQARVCFRACSCSTLICIFRSLWYFYFYKKNIVLSQHTKRFSFSLCWIVTLYNEINWSAWIKWNSVTMAKLLYFSISFVCSILVEGKHSYFFLQSEISLTVWLPCRYAGVYLSLYHNTMKETRKEGESKLNNNNKVSVMINWLTL